MIHIKLFVVFIFGLSAIQIECRLINAFVEPTVQISESPDEVKWPKGIDVSKIAPESRVVRVYFDHLVAGATATELNARSNATNKTKQSQEFETHTSSTTTTVAPINNEQASSSSSTSAPSTQNTPAPGWPVQSVTMSSTSTTTTTTSEVVSTTTTNAPQSSTEKTTTTTTTTTTTAEPPATNNDDGPVGAKTSRQGDAVLCGEANASGKSNKRLVSDRIVGGSKTEPGEFPFQVRLNIRSRRGSGICGGVILDQRHILTAAHCMTACMSQQLSTATIETSGVKATLGDHAIRSNDGEIELDVEQIIPHEKYDACNFYANDHDIAIIRTSQPIEFRFTTDGYGSINRPCMPPAGNQTSYLDGEQVIVSGWGVTRENSGALSNILRYVQVPVVNVTRCQETYGSRVTQDHVCAGLQSGGKDSCQGDSGGPLVRVVDNRYELVGIVSFGYGCGQPSAPGVYTRVASYMGWIREKTIARSK